MVHVESKLKMCWIIFWFATSILLPVSFQNIKIIEKENTETISDCLYRILEKLGTLKIAFWYSPKSEDLAMKVIIRSGVPVIINTKEYSIDRGVEVRIHDDVVVILGDLDVSKILNESLWDGHTRFFVVRQHLKEIKNDFEMFWSHKVINAFGVLLAKDNTVFYSFLPYEKISCDIGKPFIVEKCKVDSETFLYSGSAFKDPMRLKNLNQCRVNVGMANVKPALMCKDECECNDSKHVQGIEGNLMNEIAKSLNFNASFVTSLDGIVWGWIRPSPKGIVGEVFTGRNDFAIGFLAATLDRYENLDTSLPYNGQECVTFGVPKGAKTSTPNWITILVFEFSPTIWVLILFSFGFVFVLFSVANKVTLKFFVSEIDIILYVFTSCLGLPIKIPEHGFLKFSLFFWFMFTFIITVGYKSSMGSRLTVPSRNPDINTFKDLLKSKLELTGYNNMLRVMKYNDSDFIEMVRRFKVTDFDIDYAVDVIAQERQIAHVRHITTFLYYALINPKAKGHIHVLQDCIYRYYPLVLAKKHSPFINRVNQLISRLLESGVTKKWRSDYVYKLPEFPKTFNKLSNDHMYGVFCILCFGYFLGFTTFLVELIHYYFKKRKLRMHDKNKMF